MGALGDNRTNMGETMTAAIDNECPACKSASGEVRREVRVGALGTEHVIEIHHEHDTLIPHGGHRARCSCGWGSDCYAMLGDTQRAIEVHLRRCRRENFEGLIAKSSIGAAIADIKARGIDAHLVDLEREMNPRRRSTKTSKKTAKWPEHTEIRETANPATPPICCVPVSDWVCSVMMITVEEYERRQQKAN